MPTNVRTFNGTSDVIVVGAGATDVGYGTYLAVANCTATVSDSEVVFLSSLSGPSNVALAAVRFGHMGYWNSHVGFTGEAATPSVLNAWCILGVTKVSGVTSPRGHVCVLSGPTWGHADMAASGSDADVGASGWELGADQDFGDYFKGSVFCFAYWNQVLSDATFEAINGLPAIISLAPTALWVLDQESVAIPVNDSRGTGANQTSINGTTVTAGVTINNFITSPVLSDPTVRAARRRSRGTSW